MTRAVAPSALYELRNPSTAEAQVEALRQLKNEIVGHDQRKELIIRHGIVQPLVRILESGRRKGTKRRRTDTNGHKATVDSSKRDDAWTIHDEARLQAIMVVGSLALAGSALVAPLLCRSILPPLLDTLSPFESSHNVITAALRALNNIAESLTRDRPLIDSVDPTLRLQFADCVYCNDVVGYFVEILSQTSPDGATQTEISLTARLITLSCVTEQHRNMLVNARVLNLLASQLATALKNEYHSAKIPSLTAAPNPPLADLLDCIGTIIQGSHYRTAKFLYSHPIMALSSTDVPMAVNGRTTNLPENLLHTGFASTMATFDYLGLPILHAVQSKSDQAFSKAFPPLGSLNPAAGSDATRLQFSDVSLQPSLQPSLKLISAEEFESPIFSWLIHVARKDQGYERLAAIWVLALLRHFIEGLCPDEGSKNRERALAFLIVPLLVRMIEEASTVDQNTCSSTISGSFLAQRRIMERAPLVLATLIEESPMLQKAAVDAGIIKKLCQILKKTFDPIQASPKPLWSPKPLPPSLQDPTVDLASSTPGKPGFSPTIVHSLRCREAVLRALAAIADKEDVYRKTMIENGAISCITDSLTPYSDVILSGDKIGVSASPKDGNPIPVLVAACNAARSMSRSVSILRTSLIDYGIAKPILSLLNHQDTDVQIAATEVLCNLLLHFSPMRDDILEAGSLKMLCAHAHSANMTMRLNSLWALKHLVLTASNDVKISCLEELGTGWLIQALSGDLREFPLYSKIPANILTPASIGTSNAAGERVDLLNNSVEPSMEVDNDCNDGENGGKDYSSSRDEFDDDPADSDPMKFQSSLPFKMPHQIKERLRAIKRMEQDPAVKARKDELRIQEQALDFIRNLISESKGSATEMIDHLLSQVGITQFFEIMKSKLGVRSSFPGHNMDNDKLGSDQDFQQPAELLLATLFVLIHIANGKPSHRSLLISQSHLLGPLCRLFDHPDRRIRVALAWLVNNLTWMDDQSDLDAARQRARDLRIAGFEEKVRQLLHDTDLDTRERAKTAVEQISKLLEGIPSSGLIGGQSATGVTGIMDRSHRGWDR